MNKRTMKKGLAIVLALVMVFAMTATAFAATGSGSYTVSTPAATAGPINVKVVIDSRKDESGVAVSNVYNVQIGQSGVEATYTVKDVMLALASNVSNQITLYTSDWDIFSSDSNDKYIYAMDIAGYSYYPTLPQPDNPEASIYAGDGWFFRVNGRIPMKPNDSTKGADLTETYVVDKDIVHFYWNYGYTGSSAVFASDFMSVNPTYSDGTLQVQLTDSRAYFDSNYNWAITPFSAYTSTESGNYNVTVYNASGNVVKTGTIPKTGSGEITNCNLTPGQTYYVKVDTVSYKSLYDSFGTAWSIVDDTTAYEKFTA